MIPLKYFRTYKYSPIALVSGKNKINTKNLIKYHSIEYEKSNEIS